MLKKILLSGFLLFLLSLLAASLLPAVELNAQQLAVLQQLSPEQQAALVEKYRDQMPTGSPTAAEVKNPQVVTPRTPEQSSMETALRQPAADEGQPSLSARGELTATPLNQFSNAKSAEREALQKTFAAFVAESKPLQVATDLQQFGYELFAGSPSTFAPATDIPVPAEYVLGPGDELKVQLFGKSEQQLAMVVDREGMIAFPELGPLTVTGMTFSEAKAYIAEQIKQKTIGVSASISMGALRSIRIFALGEVASPGSYMVSGLATLSQALFVSGGVKKIGSLRNVQLKRNGQTVSSIDLYDFLLKGDTSHDSRLLPGDVVFVPPIGQTVAVAGEVTRPAIYELRNKTSLRELLQLAGGVKPTAYRKMALIERIDAAGKRQVLDISLLDTGLEMTLRDHDLVKIFSVSDFEENPVFLIGNVKRPGKYAWKPELRLSAILPSEAQLLPETFMEYGLIEREAASNREPELVRFRLADLFGLAGEARVNDPELQPRDKVFIFHRAHFRQQPMISIQGNVQNPGAYELKKSMRVSDLILAAGGLQRDADPDWAELYRSNPSSGELSLQKLDLKKVVSGAPEENLLLEDLDRLVIHSIWESNPRQQVSVIGAVNRPGDYPLADGMTVRELVFAAGNVTDQAFLKVAELTRYRVIDGEKRVTSHQQIDLQAALLGGAADIPLAAYDVLNVRVLSNWRSAEKVTISGQIKYPGSYPVEEGERLSSVLQRAGGYLPNAYLPGAIFERESLRRDQQQQIESMAQRIEEEIALAATSQSNIKDAEIQQRKQREIETAKRVLEEMKQLKATGRMVIYLADLESLKEGPYDLRLRDGDRLTIPVQPDAVMVIGQVYNQNAILFDEQLSREDYIEKAGGPTRFADTSRIYVVKANGEIDPKSSWRRNTMQPGDVIVIPEKLESFSLIDSTLDWSRVLMQLGIGVASMKTLNIL